MHIIRVVHVEKFLKFCILFESCALHNFIDMCYEYLYVDLFYLNKMSA